MSALSNHQSITVVKFFPERSLLRFCILLEMSLGLTVEKYPRYREI